MPELPEVQTVVDTLLPRVKGARIVGLVHLRPDIVRPCGFDLPAALVGRVVADITRRGKRIVFRLADGNHFYIHLGMTGRLTVESAGEAQRPHTHLVMEIEQPGANGPAGGRPVAQIRFCDPRRFGGVFWLGSECGNDGQMGPEPLAMTAGQLRQRLERTTRPIKNALMDQRTVAGLGNIYVDESLFAAGIHPLTPANRLDADRVAHLCRSIKLVLRRAIRHRGSTLRDYRDADGAEGGFQKLHRVYGREDAPCANCRSPIQRIVLGGRSTHFCPKCQPLNEKAAVTARATGRRQP